MQMTWSIATTFFILISRIIDTEAACVWNGAGCLLQCINSNTTEVVMQSEQLWAGREACHSSGVLLRLNTLAYTNNAMTSNWFTADIKVYQLEVNTRDLVEISPDAFNTNAFRTVTKLLFDNFKLSLIENGIFNGFDQLEIINIKYAENVNKIEKGVLDTLTELKEFTFERSSAKIPEININGWTGSEALSKLEYVKIRYNLTNSLKKSSFIGLTNVKRLDLSSCLIRYIEENTFDPISETIEELDLSANSLISLSYGVFSIALPNIKTININGNSWHCDCDLLPFRLFVEEYSDNVIGFSCSSPTECRISSLVSECFENCETPTTTTSATTTTVTTSATTTTVTTTTRTTTPSSNADLLLECHDVSVSIKRPIGSMSINQDESGNVNLRIESEYDSNSLVVIWFDESRNSGEIGEEINCSSRSGISSIPMNNLKNDIIYSFCLMDISSTSVSPLDCISYVKRDDQTVWLFESSKTLTVSLIVVSLVLNIAAGITIGYWMANRNQFSKHKDGMAKFAIGNIVNDRTSNIYTRNTTLTTNSVHGDSCPPLPERPTKYFEEPIYALVEEK